MAKARVREFAEGLRELGYEIPHGMRFTYQRFVDGKWVTIEGARFEQRLAKDGTPTLRGTPEGARLAAASYRFHAAAYSASAEMISEAADDPAFAASGQCTRVNGHNLYGR